MRESQPSNGENHGTTYAFSKENKIYIYIYIYILWKLTLLIVSKNNPGLSPSAIQKHRTKGHNFLHIGLVQIGVKPLTRRGLN